MKVQVSGIWAAIMNGLFASQNYLEYYHRQIKTVPGSVDYGLFMVSFLSHLSVSSYPPHLREGELAN